MRREAETVNFVPGGRWDEASVGTNALAIAGLGEEVLSVDIDLGEVDRWREAFPVLADRRLPDRAR